MYNALFLDTSFSISMYWKKDRHHEVAKAWLQYVLANGVVLVTTEAVLWELLNALSRRSDSRHVALQAYNEAHRDRLTEVVDAGDAMRAKAVALYAARMDKEWGITDCLSFIVMQRRGITGALTSDHHFEQAGFRALLLEDPPS